jgi:hypothetical protein
MFKPTTLSICEKKIYTQAFSISTNTFSFAFFHQKLKGENRKSVVLEWRHLAGVVPKSKLFYMDFYAPK